MNEQKTIRKFDREIARREKSSRWSRKIAQGVLESEGAAVNQGTQGGFMNALLYGFSLSAAALLVVGAVFLNSMVRESLQENELIAANTAFEDFFNPYSDNNISY